MEFLPIEKQEEKELSPLLLSFGKNRVKFKKAKLKRKKSSRKAREKYAGHHRHRYYFKDRICFNDLLILHNQDATRGSGVFTRKSLRLSYEEKTLQFGPMICVGTVKVSMRMCTRCGDSGKNVSCVDRYYVYKNEIAQNRTVLCEGCVGAKLKIRIRRTSKRSQSGGAVSETLI